jgi:rhodanese-related sulfurtransferase
MRMLTTLILFVTVAGLAAADAPDIAHQDLVKAIEAKSVVLIDVNGSESYAKAHIPGAIDFQANKDKLVELLPEDKDSLIVAYCGGPKCGAWKKAAKVATEAGYTNVKHYSAGISGWQQSQEGQTKAETMKAGATCTGGACAMGAKAEDKLANVSDDKAKTCTTCAH